MKQSGRSQKFTTLSRWSSDRSFRYQRDSKPVDLDEGLLFARRCYEYVDELGDKSADRDSTPGLGNGVSDDSPRVFPRTVGANLQCPSSYGNPRYEYGMFQSTVSKTVRQVETADHWLRERRTVGNRIRS